MKDYNCVVLDDDPISLTIVSKLLSEHGSFNLLGTFQNPDEAFAYLLQNILKAILFKRGIVEEAEAQILPINDDMPIYSILIPLYHEEFKVSAILKAMANMNEGGEREQVDLDDLSDIGDSISQRGHSSDSE